MIAARVWKEEPSVLTELPWSEPWAPHTVHYKVTITARETGELLWVRPYRTKQGAIRAYFRLVGLQLTPSVQIGELVVTMATVVTFNASNATTAATWGNGGCVCPLAVYSTDYLIVAGGAGGGNLLTGKTNAIHGGGGGAGGYRTGNIAVVPGASYATIGIGLGGASGAQGQVSFFAGITVSGGGKGGADYFVPGGGGLRSIEITPLVGPGSQGDDGGSGGGGACRQSPSNGSFPSPGGAALLSTPGNVIQGNAGGTGNAYYTGPELLTAPDDPPHINPLGMWYGGGGGGGGAGAAGQSGSGSQVKGGDGGAGLSNTISGASLFYAGGGGGGINGLGGSSIGGGGAYMQGPGTAASPANRGSGGGGAGNTAGAVPGGAGSAGVLILSFTPAGGGFNMPMMGM